MGRAYQISVKASRSVTLRRDTSTNTVARAAALYVVMVTASQMIAPLQRDGIKKTKLEQRLPDYCRAF